MIDITDLLEEKRRYRGILQPLRYAFHFDPLNVEIVSERRIPHYQNKGYEKAFVIIKDVLGYVYNKELVGKFRGIYVINPLSKKISSSELANMVDDPDELERRIDLIPRSESLEKIPHRFLKVTYAEVLPEGLMDLVTNNYEAKRILCKELDLDEDHIKDLNFLRSIKTEETASGSRNNPYQKTLLKQAHMGKTYMEHEFTIKERNGIIRRLRIIDSLNKLKERGILVGGAYISTVINPFWKWVDSYSLMTRPEHEMRHLKELADAGTRFEDGEKQNIFTIYAGINPKSKLKFRASFTNSNSE